MRMNKIIQIAKEAAERSSEKNTTLIFRDGSITIIMGSWEANKPVWLSIDGKHTEKEILSRLVEAYETPDGLPSYPEDYKNWIVEKISR